MLHNNTSHPVKSNTNTYIQSRSPIDLVKISSNAFWQFATFLCLAIAMQALGFNRANASNVENTAVRELSGQVNNSNSIRRDSSFLPKIFNLIASSTKFLPVNSGFEVATPKSAPPLRLAPLQPIAQSQKTYSADTKSLAKLKPSIHQVKQGETITAIAKEYRVSSNDLVEINQLPNSNVIFVNQRLTIPASGSNKDFKTSTPAPAIANLAPEESVILDPKTKPAKSLQPSTEDPYISKLKREIEQRRAEYKLEQEGSDAEKPNSPNFISAAETPQEELKLQPQSDSSITRRNLKPDSSIQDSLPLVLPPLFDSEEYLPSAFEGYAWPAQGVLTSGYGWRWGRLHRGIDIAAPIGTPIVAAAAGEVVGAGWHGGYGNLIKLEHLDGSVTYYAHNNRILVTHGQKVRQGDQIAEMGTTGNSTGSHLHFEIHLRDQKVANPLALLGSR